MLSMSNNLWKWLKLLQDTGKIKKFEKFVNVKEKNSQKVKFCEDEIKMAAWNPTKKRESWKKSSKKNHSTEKVIRFV